MNTEETDYGNTGISNFGSDLGWWLPRVAAQYVMRCLLIDRLGTDEGGVDGMSPPSLI